MKPCWWCLHGLHSLLLSRPSTPSPINPSRNLPATQPLEMADRTTPSYDRRRSRSPRRRDSSRLDSYRTRSPQRHHHRRKHNSTSNPTPAILPFNSRELSKRDYDIFKPMFALYLDIQKGKVLDELEEHEVRGRWKSFLGKW